MSDRDYSVTFLYTLNEVPFQYTMLSVTVGSRYSCMLPDGKTFYSIESERERSMIVEAAEG